MIEQAVSLLTLSQLVVAGIIGLMFGAFAAQFDAVPHRAARILTGLMTLFGSLFFLTLTLVRTFDDDYPGTVPLGGLGLLGLWWLACAGTLVGDAAARRWELWRSRRRHR